MELELQHPFPSLERLVRNLPPEGVAIHGTSEENAHKIVTEGFLRKRLLENWLHFYFIHPRQNFRNPYTALNGFKERLTYTHFRGIGFSNPEVENSSLVVFKPDLAEAEPLVSDEPMKRFDSGNPIWIRTQRTTGHEILGTISFSVGQFGVIDVNATVDQLSDLLESLNPSIPQSPDQE